MDWFWDAHSMQQKRESLLQKAQSKHFIVKFYQKWQDLLEKYLKYYNSMSHLELKQYSLTELKTKFQKLHELYIKAAGYGYIVDVFLSEGADWLELKIKQELGKKATPEVMATLTLPVFPSFVNKAQVLFLSIVQAIQQGETQNEVRDLCQKYVDHYFWIKATYLDHERLIPEKVYQEAMVESKQQKNIASQLKQETNRIKHNKIAKKKKYTDLHISPTFQRVIQVSEIATHIQDQRKEGVLRNNTLFFELLTFLQQKYKWHPEYAFYLTCEELFAFLGGKKIDWRDIAKRCENGIMGIFYNGKSELFIPQQYDSVLTTPYFFKDEQSVDRLQGTVAFQGKARGIVRLLRNTKEITHFQPGDILVANQTTPEFVIAMKKAAAIITDQGGITCHAAIMARELKVPCIIGTKIATHVLKDGDKVEVDAFKGIVRKL